MILENILEEKLNGETEMIDEIADFLSHVILKGCGLKIT